MKSMPMPILPSDFVSVYAVIVADAKVRKKSTTTSKAWIKFEPSPSSMDHLSAVTGWQISARDQNQW